MSCIYISLMVFIAHQQYVLCRANKINLKISSIETQIKSHEFDIKLLNVESAEMKSMILELNNTCAIGNNFENADNKKTTNKFVQRDNRQEVRLIKAFKDEKALNKETILGLKNTLEDIIRKTKLLENKTLDLFDKQNISAEHFASLKVTTGRNFEFCEIQVSEAKEEIQKLKSDILYLHERPDESNSKRNPEHKTIGKQFDELSNKITKLETSNKHFRNVFANLCDGLWIYNSVLDNCYLFISKRRSLVEAVGFCKARGARLVEIHNELALESLKKMFEETGLDWGGSLYDGFWTGGYKHGAEWYWEESGAKIEWQNWYTNEPTGGYQDKLAVMTNDRIFRWDDQESAFRKPFVCEKIVHADETIATD